MTIKAYLVRETDNALLIANDSNQDDTTSTQWIPRSVCPLLTRKSKDIGAEYPLIHLRVEGWWLSRNPEANKNITDNFDTD
jgi:hypothetical protein